MIKLVLLRHGESIWNLENRFTGWTDVGLSEKGIMEAHRAAVWLKERDLFFDVAFTSVLKRAIKTLWIVLEDMDLMYIPVFNSWRLNERHYGALQGLNKIETVEKFGAQQVLIWRRSYDTPPPALTKNDSRSPANDPRYRDLKNREIPLTECLKDTVIRFLPYWHDSVVSALKSGKRVIIAAHGNSLRALVKYLDDISDEEIVELNIPTGIPLVYELNDMFKPLEKKPLIDRYIGDPKVIKEAIESVVKQTKK